MAHVHLREIILNFTARRSKSEKTKRKNPLVEKSSQSSAMTQSKRRGHPTKKRSLIKSIITGRRAVW